MRITSHLWVGLDHALVILDRKLKFCYELLRKNIGADLIIEIKCIWKTVPAYESNKSFVNGLCNIEFKIVEISLCLINFVI